MKIEDFEFEILKTKPGDTIIIKFPIDKYDLNCIRDSFESLKNVLPDGVQLIMMPNDWTTEATE